MANQSEFRASHLDRTWSERASDIPSLAYEGIKKAAQNHYVQDAGIVGAAVVCIIASRGKLFGAAEKLFPRASAVLEEDGAMVQSVSAAIAKSTDTAAPHSTAVLEGIGPGSISKSSSLDNMPDQSTILMLQRWYHNGIIETTLENVTVPKVDTKAQLYLQNKDAVVRVLGQTFVEDGQNYRTVGSGYFVREGGLGVTNRHVARGCTTFDIETTDGTKFKAALVARDKVSDHVVFQVLNPAGRKFQTVHFAEQPGLEDLFTMGHPQGRKEVFMSSYVGSSLRVTPPELSLRYQAKNALTRENWRPGNDLRQSFDDESPDSIRRAQFIQIRSDSTNIGGSSGSPVFERTGRLIGTHTSGTSSNEVSLFATRSSATHVAHLHAMLVELPSGSQMNGWRDILTRGELVNGKATAKVIKSVEVPWKRTMTFRGQKSGITSFQIS